MRRIGVVLATGTLLWLPAGAAHAAAAAAGGACQEWGAESKPLVCARTAGAKLIWVQLAPPRTTTTRVVPGVRGNAAADVTLGKCTTKYGIGEWPITIQNRSSKRSDYAIKANFMGPTGIRLGEGLAFVSNVEPGQIASEKITGFLSDDIRTITCVLTEVTRTASL